MNRPLSLSAAGADDQHPLLKPETAEERDFLEAYLDLDDADRVLLWSALLTLLEQQGVRIPDEQ